MNGCSNSPAYALAPIGKWYGRQELNLHLQPSRGWALVPLSYGHGEFGSRAVRAPTSVIVGRSL